MLIILNIVKEKKVSHAENRQTVFWVFLNGLRYSRVAPI